MRRPRSREIRSRIRTPCVLALAGLSLARIGTLPTRRRTNGAQGRPHPRRRHRAGADRGDAARARGDRRRVRLGRARGRRGRDGEVRRNPLPPDVLDSIRETGVALKGPITTPVGSGFRRVNVALRKELDLYAQVRPCKSYPGVRIALRGRRPDHRAREHRGPLRRHRVRAGHAGGGRADRVDRGARRTAPPQRRGHLDQADLRHRHAPHLRVRLRLRAPQRPPQGHGRAQGEHHEVHRRALAAGRPRGRGRERPTSSSTTASSTTCACSSCSSRRSTTCSCCRTSTATSSPTSRAGMIGGLGVAPGANYRRDASRSSSRRTAPRRSTPARTRSTRSRRCCRACSCSATSTSASAADRLEQAIAAVIAEGKSVTYDMKPSRDDPTAVGTSEVADAIIEQLEAEVAA